MLVHKDFKMINIFLIILKTLKNLMKMLPQEEVDLVQILVAISGFKRKLKLRNKKPLLKVFGI